jgi:PAS domain S-box-containing protein
MPAKKRHKTQYPGVFYIEGKSAGTRKTERIYYIMYRKDGRKIEERAGRQFKDGMTAATAARIRIECIEGKRLSPGERRKQKKTVVVPLSKEAYDVLSAEKIRSNRNFSEIMDRALRNLSKIDDALGADKGGLEGALNEIRTQIKAVKKKHMDGNEIFDKSAVFKIDNRDKPYEELTDNEKKFREVLDHAHDMIYLVNLNTDTYEYVTPATKRRFGISPEKLISLGPDKVILSVHPDDRERVDKYIRDARCNKQGSEDRVIEYRLKMKNEKEFRWVSQAFTVLFDKEGKADSIVFTVRDISARKKEEKKLLELIDQLEKKVKEYALNLKEKNATLRVLLKQNQDKKQEIEERVLLNVKETVLPVVDKLKRYNAKDIQKYIGVLETNLQQVTSSFSSRVTSKRLNFSPQEIQVANYVMHGKTTKEIAELMALSSKTIDFHRAKIRKKTGLTNRKMSLRTFLLFLQ